MVLLLKTLVKQGCVCAVLCCDGSTIPLRLKYLSFMQDSHWSHGIFGVHIVEFREGDGRVREFHTFIALDVFSPVGKEARLS